MTLAIFFGAGLDKAFADQIQNYQVCLSAGSMDCTIDFDMRMVVTPQIVAALAGLGIAALLPVIVRRYRLQQNPPLASEAAPTIIDSVQASTYTAGIVSTGVSAASHIYHRNVVPAPSALGSHGRTALPASWP